MYLPYRDDLSAHDGILHGGVVGVDRHRGLRAVAAGHDYNKGSRITTIALAVQYFTVAPGRDIVAYARCRRRGSQVNYSDVVVRSADTDKELAQGLVTVGISGERQIR